MVVMCMWFCTLHSLEGYTWRYWLVGGGGGRSAYSGLCRQVVLIKRCISITEGVRGSAYSGLCRQVAPCR